MVVCIPDHWSGGRGSLGLAANMPSEGSGIVRALMVGLVCVVALSKNLSFVVLMNWVRVGICRSLWMMVFRTNHGALVMVHKILFWIAWSMVLWVLAICAHAGGAAVCEGWPDDSLVYCQFILRRHGLVVEQCI